MRVKEARKPISTFDRSKDNSEAQSVASRVCQACAWVEKYVTGCRPNREWRQRQILCLILVGEKKKMGYFCGWGRGDSGESTTWLRHNPQKIRF